MVALARQALSGTAGTVAHQDIEDFAPPPASLDLVISRMALHYVGHLAPVLRGCFDALAPGGRIVFTVAHPVITSHDARASPDEPRTSWVVDDYFERGPRDRHWHGEIVTWHHRTVEDHVTAVLGAGFVLDALSECAPRPGLVGEEREYRRRRRTPLVLLLAAHRPAEPAVTQSQEAR
jgi:SAM-dependent methyltransferase